MTAGALYVTVRLTIRRDPMRRNVFRSGILALALLASASVSADSQLSLSGIVSGVELCEQEVCGSALFVALFGGKIGDLSAVGLAVGGIIHQPLPVAPGCVDLLGGSWSIRTLRRTVAGDVVPGGDLCYVDGTKVLRPHGDEYHRGRKRRRDVHRDSRSRPVSPDHQGRDQVTDRPGIRRRAADPWSNVFTKGLAIPAGSWPPRAWRSWP